MIVLLVILNVRFALAQLDPSISPLCNRYGYQAPHTLCLPNSPNFIEMKEAPQQLILDLHNKFRAEITDSQIPLRNLNWDNQLALLAGQWAAQCEGDHDKDYQRTLPGINWIGQNQCFSWSYQVSWEDCLNSWAKEKEHWQFGIGSTNGSDVGHYTQIIWERTLSVGCAISNCRDSNWDYILVCNYAPGGNIGYAGRNHFAVPYTPNAKKLAELPGFRMPPPLPSVIPPPNSFGITTLARNTIPGVRVPPQPPTANKENKFSKDGYMGMNLLHIAEWLIGGVPYDIDNLLDMQAPLEIDKLLSDWTLGDEIDSYLSNTSSIDWLFGNMTKPSNTDELLDMLFPVDFILIYGDRTIREALDSYLANITVSEDFDKLLGGAPSPIKTDDILGATFASMLKNEFEDQTVRDLIDYYLAGVNIHEDWFNKLFGFMMPLKIDDVLVVNITSKLYQQFGDSTFRTEIDNYLQELTGTLLGLDVDDILDMKVSKDESMGFGDITWKDEIDALIRDLNLTNNMGLPLNVNEILDMGIADSFPMLLGNDTLGASLNTFLSNEAMLYDETMKWLGDLAKPLKMEDILDMKLADGFERLLENFTLENEIDQQLENISAFYDMYYPSADTSIGKLLDTIFGVSDLPTSVEDFISRKMPIDVDWILGDFTFRDVGNDPSLVDNKLFQEIAEELMPSGFEDVFEYKMPIGLDKLFGDWSMRDELDKYLENWTNSSYNMSVLKDALGNLPMPNNTEDILDMMVPTDFDIIYGERTIQESIDSILSNVSYLSEELDRMLQDLPQPYKIEDILGKPLGELLGSLHEQSTIRGVIDYYLSNLTIEKDMEYYYCGLSSPLTLSKILNVNLVECLFNKSGNATLRDGVDDLLVALAESDLLGDMEEYSEITDILNMKVSEEDITGPGSMTWLELLNKYIEEAGMSNSTNEYLDMNVADAIEMLISNDTLESTLRDYISNGTLSEDIMNLLGDIEMPANDSDPLGMAVGDLVGMLLGNDTLEDSLNKYLSENSLSGDLMNLLGYFQMPSDDSDILGMALKEGFDMLMGNDPSEPMSNNYPGDMMSEDEMKWLGDIQMSSNDYDILGMAVGDIIGILLSNDTLEASIDKYLNNITLSDDLMTLLGATLSPVTAKDILDINIAEGLDRLLGDLTLANLTDEYLKDITNISDVYDPNAQTEIAQVLEDIFGVSDLPKSVDDLLSRKTPIGIEWILGNWTVRNLTNHYLKYLGKSRGMYDKMIGGPSVGEHLALNIIAKMLLGDINGDKMEDGNLETAINRMISGNNIAKDIDSMLGMKLIKDLFGDDKILGLLFGLLDMESNEQDNY